MIKLNLYYLYHSCLPNGLVNVSSCIFDSPVVISLPHFLYGSYNLQENISGLNPNPDLHGFHMDIEPVNARIYL